MHNKVLLRHGCILHSFYRGLDSRCGFGQSMKIAALIAACQGCYSCQPTFPPFPPSASLKMCLHTSIPVFQLGQITLELKLVFSLEKVKIFRLQRQWWPLLKKLYITKLNSTSSFFKISEFIYSYFYIKLYTISESITVRLTKASYQKRKYKTKNYSRSLLQK